MGTATSPSSTWRLDRSASEYTATERMPILRRVAMIRTAISPRLATNTVSKARLLTPLLTPLLTGPIRPDRVR